MSFSFTEPSTTHPTAEENPVETKEVTTDAATTDIPADAGTAVIESERFPVGRRIATRLAIPPAA